MKTSSIIKRIILVLLIAILAASCSSIKHVETYPGSKIYYKYNTKPLNEMIVRK